MSADLAALGALPEPLRDGGLPLYVYELPAHRSVCHGLSRDKDDGRSAYASTLLRARRSVFTGDGDNMMYHRYVRPQRCNMKLLQRGYGMESKVHATQRKWPHVPVQVAAPCSVEGGCYSADSKRFGMTSTSYCARPQQREQCSRSIENAPQSTSYLCKYFQPAMQASTLGTRTSHGCDDFQAEQPYTCRSGAARARRHAWSSAAPFLRRSGLPFLTVAITMSPHMLAQVSDHEISCQSVIISPLR